MQSVHRARSHRGPDTQAEARQRRGGGGTYPGSTPGAHPALAEVIPEQHNCHSAFQARNARALEQQVFHVASSIQLCSQVTLYQGVVTKSGTGGNTWARQRLYTRRDESCVQLVRKVISDQTRRQEQYDVVHDREQVLVYVDLAAACHTECAPLPRGNQLQPVCTGQPFQSSQILQYAHAITQFTCSKVPIADVSLH